MKLIDKSALLAEIERRYETNIIGTHSAFRNGKIEALREVKDLITTLEVKGVDLENEFNQLLDTIDGAPRMWHSDEQIEWGKDIAKHFFELGMLVSNKQIEEKRYIKTGIELIAEERQRQIDVEGYSKEHDMQHDEGEFLDAAACYMTPPTKRPRLDVTHELDCQPPDAFIYDQKSSDGTVRKMKILTPPAWPWGEQHWKPTPLDRVRELVKAGALIAAAIDRLQEQKRK